jgi:replicative DNA helicase
MNRFISEGIPTGFKDLDMMTGGIKKGELTVISGRPSMGKTTLASSIIEHAAVVEKIPCVYFSLEMSKDQLAQRILCSMAKADVNEVKKGVFSRAQWPNLIKAAEELSGTPIVIDDTAGISAIELRAQALRLIPKHNIKLVIVDYLQLMKGASNNKTRKQAMLEISRSLKALARELDIAVILVSQLSRVVEQRSGHKPMLSDLRGSGVSEQDADAVMLILRNEYYDPADENKGITEINVAKQRNGQTGKIFLKFSPRHTKFTDHMKNDESDRINGI